MHIKSEDKCQKWNHIDTLITRKHFKEEKKVDIKIMKEEDGILVNIHGTRHHKITLQKAIIRDQQPLQIGEATKKYMESKERKLCNN
jgi:hypothetical protein